MKILFIRPRPAPETIGLQHVMIVEPLELEVLAACVGPDDEVVIYDLLLERELIGDILADVCPDVLAVTGYITNVPGMLACCAAAKAHDQQIVTIVGGVHCEVCPADLDHPAVDFRVVRNATTVFRPLLEHLRGDGDVPRGILQRGEVVDPSALPTFDFAFPLPLRHLVERYRRSYFYIFHDRVALIKTSFGCPHDCRFCFCKAITCGAYAQRPLAEVMDELSALQQREIYIVDDDFLADRRRVESFIAECDRRVLRKHYLIYGRADFIAAHPDIMAEFKRVGLRTVIVGIESFFDDELDRYGKGTMADTNQQALTVLRRLGIDVYATMIVAPEWTSARFAACGRILKSLGIHYVNLQPLTPLPGTGLACADELILARDEFTKWDLAHVSIRPHHMSVAQFYREIIQLYDSLLFRPGVLLGYLLRYSPARCWKMLKGSWRVRRQYLEKIREAENDVGE